jgi:hypothetical protein
MMMMSLDGFMNSNSSAAAEFERDQKGWFRVGRILDTREAHELFKLIESEGLKDNQFAFEALSKLHTVVHIDKIINYYLVTKADAERALNVFLRVNSGGRTIVLIRYVNVHCYRALEGKGR